MLKPGNFITVLLLLTAGISLGQPLTGGPRSSGMGGLSAAWEDEWAGLQNPAMLAFLKDPAGGVAYENRFLLNEISTRYGVFTLPTKAGNFGVSITHFGFPLYSEFRSGLNYSRTFGEKFGAGVQINYVRTALGEDYGTRQTLIGEIGVAAEVVKGLTLGAHLFNPNRSLLDKNLNEPYPTVFTGGFLYAFSDKVKAGAEVVQRSDAAPTFRTGIEYKLHPSVWLRAGIKTKPVESAFGTSFVIKNLRLDLATTWHQVLGLSPQAGLLYAFN